MGYRQAQNGVSMRGLVGMRKKVIVVIRDAKTGKEVDRRESEELMTRASKAYVASRYANPSSQILNSYWRAIIGTGSGTPSDTDTNLFQPQPDTEKSVSVSVNDNVVTFHVYYFPWEANGRTYTEVGLFLGVGAKGSCYEYNSSTNQYSWTGECTMHEHGTFTGVTKTDQVFLDIYVVITFV